MKLRKPIVKTVETKKERAPAGERKDSWTGFREKLLKLQPVPLLASPQVLVCDVMLRPYLSKVSKMEGITYTTIGIDDSRMAVVRYDTKPVKKGKSK